MIATIFNWLKIPLTILVLLYVSLLLVSVDSSENYGEFFYESRNLPFTTKTKNLDLNQIVTSHLSSPQGQYAVYIKDLKTGKIYTMHDGEMFSSASLYKLAVMYKTYDELANGSLSKDDLLSEQKVTLEQTLVGEDLSQQDGSSITTNEVIAYNVKEALRLMITISDNYAALLLAEKLGWGNIETFVKNKGYLGIDLTSKESPRINAQTAGAILESIYTGRAVNPQASQEMRDLLVAQTVNNRIPKYLPTDVKVAHKTGELGNLRHDAGIVYGKNSHYIFVFLSETDQPEEASETIALLSKKIYDELEK